ncbi:hypothetical protein KEM54_000767 [Ascosphaera aggregata]|nr:hypothetical protein KEM54_000767 [Ascosphaera aggregata]
MLRAFMKWDNFKPEVTEETPGHAACDPMNWQERYIMLLWLSHLLLAPFPLKTLSTELLPIPYDNLSQLPSLSPDLPYAALPILSICLRYIPIPGKEREAATLLLARLALRLDMQQLGLLQQLNHWAFSILKPQESTEEPSVYACIGVLSFVYRLCALGQAQDLAPLLLPIFKEISRLTEGTSVMTDVIRCSSSSRKIIIKVLRAITTLVLTLENTPKLQLDSDAVSEILENAIDYFLVSLADADTPVRLAASKALSITALKLDTEMASDVIDAVIGSLDENILYETEDGKLITPYEARSGIYNAVKRNVSAVDPLRWQGLILTLAHLLFFRSTPVSQLPDVFRSLVASLNFEQRSSTGTSVGGGVRDASNFGIWALSRKYSTKELLCLKVAAPELSSLQYDSSILQILAIQLVCSGCLDPSGNIRRGSSAALQELIGRHPDTIFEAIPLVQVVDYHSVARRSRAMVEVSAAAAQLHAVYWAPLLDGLLEWRGIRSPDAESRRVAAKAIGRLASQQILRHLPIVLEKLTKKLRHTSPDNIERRHGLYLALSAAVDSYIANRSNIQDGGSNEAYEALAARVLEIWKIFGSNDGPSEESLTQSVLRPDLTAEAAANLISSLSRAVENPRDVPADGFPQAAQVILLCVQRPDEVVIKAASRASRDLFGLFKCEKRVDIIKTWVKDLRTVQRIETGRGVVAALASVFQHMDPSSKERAIIIEELLRCTQAHEGITKRVTSLKCITAGCLPHIENVNFLLPTLTNCLNDYTTDRRGDIGSLVRLEALEAVSSVAKLKGVKCVESLYPYVVRLAVEKLDKSNEDFPPMTSETSSSEYFLQALQLLQIPSVRRQLLKGLATSASLGSESLIRASRHQFLKYLRGLYDELRCIEVTKILNDLVDELYASLSDDRFAIPIVELIAFLLDAGEHASGEEPLLSKVFIAVQESHFRSANIPRIEAAVKVYAVLWRNDAMRSRVRNVVADHLYMETGVTELKGVDWTVSPKDLKMIAGTVQLSGGALKAQ